MTVSLLPKILRYFRIWVSDLDFGRPIQSQRQGYSLLGFLATNVHPSVAHMWRPERYAADPAVHPQIQERGREAFDGYLRQIDSKLTGRNWFSDQYSVADPYLFVFYPWG